MPVRNMGIDMKNPPIAQVRLILDFSKYLLSLNKSKDRENKLIYNLKDILYMYYIYSLVKY